MDSSLLMLFFSIFYIISCNSSDKQRYAMKLAWRKGGHSPLWPTCSSASDQEIMSHMRIQSMNPSGNQNPHENSCGGTCPPSKFESSTQHWCSHFSEFIPGCNRWSYFSRFILRFNRRYFFAHGGKVLCVYSYEWLCVRLWASTPVLCFKNIIAWFVPS